MFVSDTQRSDPSKISLSPGPAAYNLEEIELGKRKDFSRPVKIFVGPVRNLDGAITRSNADPSI